jgi:hypothetical protein
MTKSAVNFKLVENAINVASGCAAKVQQKAVRLERTVNMTKSAVKCSEVR